MKGRYNGCRMTIYGHILPGAVSLANWAARISNISEKAKQRLRVVDWLRLKRGNVSLTARHFGLDRNLTEFARDRVSDVLHFLRCLAILL